MNQEVSSRGAAGRTQMAPAGAWSRWMPAAWVLAALMFAYAPVFVELAQGLWLTDTHSHGPVVLAAVIWLFVRGLKASGAEPVAAAPTLGWPVLLAGLAMYVLGRSQSFPQLEVASLLPVVLGSVLLLLGVAPTRRLWFAFLFMVFLVPLPGSIIDVVTQPMKLAVSYVTEHLLYWAGYPIARAGVVLTIGQYQLLVADACSGLNSLFMLEAFGLLYMNLVRHESMLRNVALAILIVPISFVSNTLRVVVLALLTYHLGDAAGQGFLHSFSGMVLFAVALVLIVVVDGLLRAIGPARQRAAVVVPAPVAAHWPRPGARPSALVALAVIVAGATALAITPQAQVDAGSVADLDAAVPHAFGDWVVVPSPYVQVSTSIARAGEGSQDVLYDQTVMRTYRNARGESIMLALAYGRQQRQELKIHRPDLCYTAQGFALLSRDTADFGSVPGTSSSVAGHRMLAERQGLLEAVSYWIRIGSLYSEDAVETRMHLFAEGLQGRVPDGVLVRVSSLLDHPDGSQAAFDLQRRFVTELLSATPPAARALLVR